MPRKSRQLAQANENLRGELRTHARRAKGVLRFQRGIEALPGALVEGMPFLLVAPAVYLLFRILLWFSAPIDPPMSFGLAVLGLLAPYVLFVLAQVISAACKAVPFGAALRHVDDQLHLSDRLQTAADFLDRPQRTAFMEAAIEDASTASARALGEPLRIEPNVEVPSSKAWLYPLGGAFLVFLGILIPIAGTPKGPIQVASTKQMAESDVATAQDEELMKPVVLPGATPKLQKPNKSENSKATVGASGALSPKDQKMKAGSGKTKAGKAAPVGAPSGSAQAKGAPSDEGKPAQSKKLSRKKAKPRKPKSGQDRIPKGKKQENDRQSGATMGRGSGQGSSKNPVASEWSSKDQTPQDDEEPEDDDEEVEDESEKSDARGGVQPNLRDRRPPSSRDLAIGFGNRPGGDGRGGPSQRKKSRGTASLVLGVPIPDHIKGQMNPGTTKITQERIEPKEEESQAIKAEARVARRGYAGAAQTPQGNPRLNQVIESYFRALRAKSEKDEKK